MRCIVRRKGVVSVRVTLQVFFLSPFPSMHDIARIRMMLRGCKKSLCSSFINFKDNIRLFEIYSNDLLCIFFPVYFDIFFFYNIQAFARWNCTWTTARKYICSLIVYREISVQSLNGGHDGVKAEKITACRKQLLGRRR